MDGTGGRKAPSRRANAAAGVGAARMRKSDPLYLNLIVIEVLVVKRLKQRFLPQLSLSVLVLRYLH